MTTKGFIVEATYSETDENNYCIDSMKSKFYCLPLGKDRTMVCDGAVLFTLPGSPSQESLNKFFTERSDKSERTLINLNIVNTFFDASQIEKLNEMEAFRKKAVKAQAKVDKMFSEFTTIQQSFCLLF